MSAGPTVVCAGVSKVFRSLLGRTKVKALDGVGFVVRRGEVFALVGPEGSGKSTALKIVKGLIDPSQGEVQVLGAPAWANTISARVGYVGTENILDLRLTCFEALTPPPDSGHTPVQRLGRAGELLELIGLETAGKQMIGELSPGLQRCVSIGQAVTLGQEVLILDEPLRGLAEVESQPVKRLIRSLAGAGKTVLVSARWLADATGMCDRAAILFDGRIEAQGTLEEIFAAPGALRVVAPVLPEQVSRRTLATIFKELGGSEIVWPVTEAQIHSPEIAKQPEHPKAAALAKPHSSEPEEKQARDWEHANKRLSSLLGKPGGHSLKSEFPKSEVRKKPEAQNPKT